MPKTPARLIALAVALVLSASALPRGVAQDATAIAGQPTAASPLAGAAAAITSGTCANPAADATYPLSDLSIPTRSGTPSATTPTTASAPASPRIATSFTTIDRPLADLLAQPHAIVVRAGAEGSQTLACSNLVGPATGNNVVALLSPRTGTDGSVAWLQANPDGTTTVALAVFPLQQLCPSVRDGTPTAASPTTLLDLLLIADELDLGLDLSVANGSLRFDLTSPTFDLDADLISDGLDLAVDLNAAEVCLDVDLVIPELPLFGTPPPATPAA